MPYCLRLQPSPQIKTEKYFSNCLAGSRAVLCAAYDGAGRLFIGAEKGLLFFDGERFVKLCGPYKAVNALCLLPDGVLAAASENTIYTVTDSAVTALQTLPSPVLELKAAGDRAYALTADMLYSYADGRFSPEQETAFSAAVCMAPTPGKAVYVACDGAVTRLMAKRTRFGVMTPSMTHTPAVRFACMAADPLGTVWCGTEKGVYVFDGRSEWTPPAELPAFPRGEITCLALGKKNVYAGTPAGLYVISPEHTRFYGAGRYLTGSRVFCVLPSPDESELTVCAEDGVSRIRFVPMTLAEKAAYFEALLPYFTREDYYTRRVDMKNGNLASGNVQITDNDGLYTADAVAFYSMKYAVTGDEAAKEAARRTMKALLKLQRVTGIPGFPARAYRRPGEHRYGDGDPEWHAAVDETGPLEWKGETSSDELVGHFFAAGWYYDLCADAAEKAELAEAYRAITEHILTHGYTLCDADGTPTSWAHFGPDELNGDDAWCWEKGVNALELLSFLRLTYHFTGDEKYLALQKSLAAEHHYAMNVLAYKKDDAHSSVIDDRLTLYIATHLLRLETDEALLRYARLGIRRHYEYIKENYAPYFAFVYALSHGGHTDLDEAVRVLEEFPLDLRCHKTDMRCRPDLEMDPRTAEFGEEPHLLHPLPASERVTDEMHSGARAFFCGRDNAAYSPCGWLLAYWAGRYFGLLEA